LKRREGLEKAEGIGIRRRMLRKEGGAKWGGIKDQHLLLYRGDSS